MEPNHNSYQSSVELPQPVQEGGLQGADQLPAQPERNTQPPATLTGKQPFQPVTPTQIPTTIPTSQQQPGTSIPPTGTSDLIADDVDLIEKEWVVKAKAIVAQTKDDPYQQNRAMSGVKADYLKKRYNKDLRVSNEN